MNIAEILRNAPKGMKLYSPLFGECELDYVYSDSTLGYQIEVVHNGRNFLFTSEGKFENCEEGECILFPSVDCDGWGEFEEQNKIEIPVVCTDTETDPSLDSFNIGIHKGFNYVDVGTFCGKYKVVIPFEDFDPKNIKKSMENKL